MAPNFRKEVLTSKVVGLHGTYHAIIGHPRYAKFMDVPNYTYLKLNMLGPKGIITISSSYEHTFKSMVVELDEADDIALRGIWLPVFHGRHDPLWPGQGGDGAEEPLTRQVV